MLQIIFNIFHGFDHKNVLSEQGKWSCIITPIIDYWVRHKGFAPSSKNGVHE